MEPHLDECFSRLATIRHDLASVQDAPDGLSADASRHYVGIDLLARDVLSVAVFSVWTVPEPERGKARRERSLPFLVRLGEEYAPSSVNREILARIAGEFHPLRNAIEHRGRQANLRKCHEYIELVESLTYSVTEPSVPDPPYDMLSDPDVKGFRVMSGHTLARGLLPHPWAVIHGSKEADYGSYHVLEFWRYDKSEWRRMKVHHLGQWNIATLQRLQSRSLLEEELLVWRRGGESMGVMSYDILAMRDDQIVRLLTREAISGAYVIPRGRAIEEHAGDRIIRFEWDGSAYVGQRIIRQDPAEIDIVDLRYRVTGTTVLGPSEITLKVGQKLRIVRDDLEPTVVRTLMSGAEVLNWGSESFSAAKVGETAITLIPGVYDWQHALEVKVRVLAN